MKLYQIIGDLSSDGKMHVVAKDINDAVEIWREAVGLKGTSSDEEPDQIIKIDDRVYQR